MEYKAMNECEWSYDDGVWSSSCGNGFIFNEYGPKENEFEFCPYCGKKLIEKDGLNERAR